MWDEETKALVQSQEGWVGDQLKHGMKVKVKSQAMEKEAKSLKELANAEISVALDILGVGSVVDDKIGTARLKPGTNISYRPELIEQSLLAAGVDVEVIKDAIEAGTKRTKYVTVELRSI